jgi:hypothetical protein
MYTRRRKNGEEKYHGAVQISTLFEKYKRRLRPPQGVVVSAFCAVVLSELGVTLPPTHVCYSAHSRILSVTTFGPQKTEILLRRTHILTLCRDILGELGSPQHIV